MMVVLAAAASVALVGSQLVDLTTLRRPTRDITATNFWIVAVLGFIAVCHLRNRISAACGAYLNLLTP